MSCTVAMEAARSTASPSARRTSSLPLRRACMRSSEAMVCRLFLTRWWTSRMVASLTPSSRSRRRASVRSSTSTSAPAVSEMER